MTHLDDFVRHLIAKHEADLRFDPKVGNRHHDKAIAAFRKFYVEDEAWQERLKPLLEHTNVTVRGWVGAILLCAGHDPARAVLETDSTIPGLVGGNAEWTLRVFDMGELKPYCKDIPPKKVRRNKEH